MWNYPRVIAHRGGGTLAPENTLAALRCALAHGYRAVEFDVMAVQGDGLVLMHDLLLGRTVRGKGSVADYTREALSLMDAGSWYSAVFAGEPVPDFESAANFCVANGLWLNAEIKPVPGMDAQTGRLVGAACASLPAGSVLLSSFSEDALRAARSAAPDVPRALLVERVPDDWGRRLHALGAVALHVNAHALHPEQASVVKKAGFGLFCYTVNDPDQARMLNSVGVDAICTDRLDLISPDFLGPA